MKPGRVVARATVWKRFGTLGDMTERERAYLVVADANGDVKRREVADGYIAHWQDVYTARRNRGSEEAVAAAVDRWRRELQGPLVTRFHVEVAPA